MSVSRRSEAPGTMDENAPGGDGGRSDLHPLHRTRTTGPRWAWGAARRLVWNEPQGRLRAGWRLLVFLVLLLVVAVAEDRLQRALAGRLPDLYDGTVRALAFALMIVALFVLASRVLDRRSFTDYGFHLSRPWWTELGLGLGLGALLMVGTVSLELALGWVRIADTFVSAPGQPFAATLLLGLVAVAAVAFGEEASYRAYPIKNFTEGLGTSRWRVAAAVSIPAIYFGMAHMTNPGATWLSTTNTVIFGLLCGTAYVLTGELAFPIGLHFAWDYIQAFVFGVTGTGSHYGALLVLAPSGAAGTPRTGLPYGVEAGALGTLALAIGFMLMAAWIRIRAATSSPAVPET